MSLDYKAPYKKTNAGSSMLTGILIGLLLGLAIALAVAWYMNHVPSPFSSKTKISSTPTPPPNMRQPNINIAKEANNKQPETASTANTKPRFDFYKILPGSEETIKEQDVKSEPSESADANKYYIQAGAFQNSAEADNLKANLALLGLEASIQTTNSDEKGIVHRVRLGPYSNSNDISRVRGILKQNNIDSTLIKVHETASQ